MAQDAIRGRMDDLWSKAREELLGVMDKAEAGTIISGTEWEVRRVYQRLARDCFELMVRGKGEGLDQTTGGAFFPSGVAAGPAGPAEGRGPLASGHHRQR